MAQDREFGQYGFDIITGTESGAWVAVQAVGGDATFSGTCAIGDNQSSITLLDDAFTYGTFTQLVVTSGTIKAYRNVTGDFDAQINTLAKYPD